MTNKRFILELKLNTRVYQEHKLDKVFKCANNLYNGCVYEAKKRINRLEADPRYKPLAPNDKKAFYELLKEYKLYSKNSLDRFVKNNRNPYSKYVDSTMAQKIGIRVMVAVSKYFFGNGKEIKTKNYQCSVEGKSNKGCIQYVDGYVEYKDLIIPVIIKDDYQREALTNRICYCRIKRVLGKRKYHYYVQLVLEGTPPPKRNKDGSFKHKIGMGKVGIDIGTQTIAVASDNELILEELAPAISKTQKKIVQIEQKMDRSKRTMNPNKFNSDGTINTDNHEPWIYSKKYRVLATKRRIFYFKLQMTRKMEHCILANRILRLGNEFFVEKMSFKGLQRRSKTKATVNPKTGKYNRKKRFGKSLATKAPALLLGIINTKLSYIDKQLIKVSTFDIKASQYNHIDDTYIKKELNERWNIIGNDKIQRDLYSALILSCLNKDNKSINRTMMIKKYDKFKDMHDNLIEKLKVSDKKLISSFGIN